MKHCTIQYSENIRISDGGLLEVHVREIQHRKSDLRDVGMYALWREIIIDGKGVAPKQSAISDFCYIPRPFVGSTIIWKGNYFIDSKGFLCDHITVCLPSRSFYFGAMFVFLTGQPIEAVSL